MRDRKDKHIKMRLRKTRITYKSTRPKNYGNIFSKIKSQLKKEYIIYGCVSAIMIIAVAFSIAQGIKNQRDAKQEKDALAQVDNIISEETEETQVEIETPEPEIRFVDLIYDIVEIKPSTRTVGQPVVFGDTIAWGGGDGALYERFMKSLFIYDLNTDEEQEVSKARVNFGEIHEVALTREWIAWTDTDNNGICRIMGKAVQTWEIDEASREQGSESLEAFEITTLRYDPVGIEIDRDCLVWIDRSDMETNYLYLFNMVNGDMDIIAELDPVYGNSIPFIKNGKVIWADRDPLGGENDSIIRIYNIDTDQEEPHLKIGDYAHKPVTNGRAIAWINGNHCPNSKLMLSPYGTGYFLEIEQGVTNYGLGSNFLVYGKNDLIYLYFWERDEYAVLLEEHGGGARNIRVNGNRIIWLDYSEGSTRQDIIMTVVIEHP